MGSDGEGDMLWIRSVTDEQLSLCIDKARDVISHNRERRMSGICSKVAATLYLMIPIVAPVLVYHQNYIGLLYELLRSWTSSYQRNPLAEGEDDDDLWCIAVMMRIMAREVRRVRRVGVTTGNGRAFTFDELCRHYGHHIEHYLESGESNHSDYINLCLVFRSYGFVLAPMRDIHSMASEPPYVIINGSTLARGTNHLGHPPGSQDAASRPPVNHWRILISNRSVVDGVANVVRYSVTFATPWEEELLGLIDHAVGGSYGGPMLNSVNTLHYILAPPSRWPYGLHDDLDTLHPSREGEEDSANTGVTPIGYFRGMVGGPPDDDGEVAVGSGRRSID